MTCVSNAPLPPGSISWCVGFCISGFLSGSESSTTDSMGLSSIVKFRRYCYLVGIEKCENVNIRSRQRREEQLDTAGEDYLIGTYSKLPHRLFFCLLPPSGISSPTSCLFYHQLPPPPLLYYSCIYVNYKTSQQGPKHAAEPQSVSLTTPPIKASSEDNRIII